MAIEERDQLVNGESESDSDIIQFVNRQDLLTGKRKGVQTPEEKAVDEFLTCLAIEPHIRGVAISHIRPIGIYTHFIVANFSEKEAIRRVLNLTGRVTDLLETAGNESAGYMSYVSFEDVGMSPRAFAEWYVEEFHKPKPEDPDEAFANEFFGALQGSSEEMELRRIVMFEDPEIVELEAVLKGGN